MKSLFLKLALLLFIIIVPASSDAQEFQGKAVYLQKTKMQLGSWGARMSEAQKKQIKARLKNRLEKTYILTFNRSESTFLEDEKIDAISGATDSWGAYFSRGDMYRNTKESKIAQSQEFYGKRFVVKDSVYKIDWTMGTETKKIGDYTVYKAMAIVPTNEIAWYNFSWGDLRAPQKDPETGEIKLKTTTIEAWYTPQIPVNHGPGEFWGLPGLILEVSAGDTVMLCSEIAINSGEKVKIKAPDKGEVITKANYSKTVKDKMMEMRNNRMGRRRSR